MKTKLGWLNLEHCRNIKKETKQIIKKHQNLVIRILVPWTRFTKQQLHFFPTVVTQMRSTSELSGLDLSCNSLFWRQIPLLPTPRTSLLIQWSLSVLSFLAQAFVTMTSLFLILSTLSTQGPLMLGAIWA